MQYNKALVRGLANSFAAGALRAEEPSEPPSTEKMAEELAAYNKQLEECGVELIRVEPDHDHPDCIFVEDTAVVAGNRVLICRPGHPSRQGEIDPIKAAFESLSGSNLELHDMRSMSETATLDGGDVMFTGKEFFVGLSKRTNEEGVEILAKVFDNYPVHSVKVVEGLHLKSVVTPASEELLVVADNRAGREALQAIQSQATAKYDSVLVPEALAANVLRVNDHLLVSKGFPESLALIKEKIPSDLHVHELWNREGAKADGALTCRSILFTV
ncbi:N(G),N(G)-dimethylarginine dimethylaminohydrolase 1 [Balamuthia mandrillaris]